MSWNLLTAEHIFEFVDYMMSLNLHPNAFVMNPVTSPDYFDICNLPKKYIDFIIYNSSFVGGKSYRKLRHLIFSFS